MPTRRSDVTQSSGPAFAVQNHQTQPVPDISQQLVMFSRQ
ncbi:EspF repeat-containing protein [Morganella morganii]